MAIYSETGLLSAATDDVTEYTADELTLQNGYISTQLLGALKMQSEGVSARYGPNSFKVTAGSGLSVSIAAGAGNLYHSTKGAVAFERTTAYTLSDLLASTTRYLFATYEDSDDNNTIKSGIPYFVLNETDVLANGLLLAKIVTDSDSVTSVEDLRVFATPPRYRQAWDAATQYEFNDTVTHAGNLWFALQDNLNSTPEEGDDWTLLAGISGTAVTSVGLSLPSLFSVTGSPVTGSGTLTATLADQAANTVLAGPAAGAAAAPTFRQLSAADISDFVETAGYAFIGVADVTALRAVTSHADKQIIYVVASGVTNGSFFHFDAASVVADNGSTVIQPTDISSGAGRWLRIGTGANDADTLEGQDGSYYLDRVNHSGEQAISTITGLQTALDGMLTKAGSLTGIGNANDARTNLGLGSIATQAASAVNITGGTVSGITDLALADGGTGASDAAGARTNLGLGDSATLDVGTGAGTVAAGNDSRLSDARTPAINGLTAETEADDADEIAIYDSSAAVIRKMTRSNFLAGVVPLGVNHEFYVQDSYAPDGNLGTLLIGPRGEAQEEVTFYANETEEGLETALAALDGIVEAVVTRTESQAYIALSAAAVTEDGVFDLPETFGTGAGAGGALTIDGDDDLAAITAKVQAIAGYEDAEVHGTGDYAA